MVRAFRGIVESGVLRRIGVAASVFFHLIVIGWLVFGADVKLFAPSQPSAIMVELVPPDQLTRREEKKEPEKKPDEKSSGFDLPTASPSTPPAPEPKQEAAPSPQPSQQPSPSVDGQQASQGAAASDPSAPPTSEPAAHPEQMPATFGAPVTKPDVVEQYGTFFQPFDAGGYQTIKQSAKLDSDVVTTFRAHLKTCSPRPASLSASDDVHIVMRVALRRDGKLAGTPALVEAKASPKGPVLMQAAIQALQKCQPYSMLPPDKYDEWKVLDLDFSPADFTG